MKTKAYISGLTIPEVEALKRLVRRSIKKYSSYNPDKVKLESALSKLLDYRIHILSDEEALKILARAKDKFKDVGGVIWIKQGAKISKIQQAALDYLFFEFDYAIEEEGTDERAK